MIHESLSFSNVFQGPSVSVRQTSTSLLRATPKDSEGSLIRRQWLRNASRVAGVSLGLISLYSWTQRPALAAASRSRTDGYAVQKTEEEWKDQLSSMQYFVLRQGGTERPNFSVLSTASNQSGVYKCAGCGTDLFVSKDKFQSGTGWPSFARGLKGAEVDPNVSPLAKKLAGAELRCQTCGGHLGDVFEDGFLFVGTEAAVTGERYCIDGAALVFYPDGGGSAVRGDTQLVAKAPAWMESPKITARERES